jgi:predicted DNA-binding transcriptional regulator AlpA
MDATTSPSRKKPKRTQPEAAAESPPGVRLLNKAEILRITGVSFPTIWQWMRDGKFPRSYVIGGGNSSKSVWRSDQINDWIAALPIRQLKPPSDKPNRPRRGRPRQHDAPTAGDAP